MKTFNISQVKNIKTSDVVEGVSARFFLQHFSAILVGLFMAMVYISARFDCTTAMERVQRLRIQLEVVRTETQRERSAYMSATCESSMQQLVDTLHLGLNIQERPPYVINMSSEK